VPIQKRFPTSPTDLMILGGTRRAAVGPAGGKGYKLDLSSSSYVLQRTASYLASSSGLPPHETI
jgi:hypothetical protein